ncbi:Kinesin-like protein KIF20A [Taenia crassiceps]|uniref:Kinesin-like protein KIF20A n=1 Tax=Taenia crassiceps TaxID=6207 RepID=A0ABR4QGC7_9CEST
MSHALSFTPVRDQSFGLYPAFNFAALNRNLLNEFNERESSVLRKDEQMPVYLRIRPLNPGEAPDKVLFACDATRVVLKPLVEDKGLRAGMFAFGQSSHEFTFSRVFGEVTTQAEIFKAVAAERVSEFLEGVNGLVFAYGTTSSGKTYSLQGTAGNGGEHNAKLDGRLVPRGFDEVQEVTEVEAEKRRQEKALLLRLARTTETLSRSRAVSWESVRPPSEARSLANTGGEAVTRVEEECLEVPFAYKDSAAFCFWISFVEIYNEVVYDLLDPDFASTIEKCSRASSGLVGGGGVTVGCGGGGPFGMRRAPLDLRTDKRGNVFVKGVRWYAVSSAEEAYSLISVGRCCQRVGATRLNESSSRSHTILTLRALRSRRGAPIGVGIGAVGSSSLLSFCDLAGSERCTKAATLAQVQRLREANSINTSLLALGKCIDALRHNQRRGGGGGNPRIVPYRESRLTRLFQNFFVAAGPGAGGRGRSRACLLVNAAPCASLAEETLHSLRFSALAGQVLMSTAAPPPLPPPKAAAASAAIQDQLRAQLLRQGFRLRCSGSLLAVASAETTMMGVEELEGTATMVRHVASGACDDGDGDGGGGVIRRPLAEWVDEAVEAELERLPREELIEMVHELLAAVAEALPAEVEAVRSETRAEVTATMGEELLRMEEQYELLLQKQEREFEARLAEEHRKCKQRQQRRGRQGRRSEGLQLRRQGGCGNSDADCAWVSSTCVAEGGEGEAGMEGEGSGVGGSKIVESSDAWTREPLAKTRRVEGKGGGSEEAAEAKVEADEEEGEEEDECPSCAYYVKEVARLREELEEARGDLVDQQDAIAGVMAQRDAFEVEVRRLGFLLQLAKQPLEVNSAKPASTATVSAIATATTSSTVTSFFPSLLGAEAVVIGSEPVVASSPSSTEVVATSGKQQQQYQRLREQSSCGAGDTKFFPPLISPPNRVCGNVTVVRVAAVDRRGEVEGGVGGEGECVKVEESGSSSMVRQRAESRGVPSQVKDVRVDAELSGRRSMDEEVKVEVLENGWQSKSSVARMASFLAHEAEAEVAAAAAMARESELQLRCEALSRDLSDARSAHEEVMAQLVEVQRRLKEYEVKEGLERQYCKREQMDAAVQTEVVVEVEDGEVVASGRRGTRGRCRQGQRQRRTGAKARRKTPATMVRKFEGTVEVAELNDSDAENVLCEQLAWSLGRIHVDAAAAGPGDSIGDGGGSTAEAKGDVEVERRYGRGNRGGGGGHRRGVKSRREGVDAEMRVTRSMCVDNGGGGGGGGGELGLTEEHEEVVNVRRLVPLSEVGQFVNLESEGVEEVTPRPFRRVLRRRRVV